MKKIIFLLLLASQLSYGQKSTPKIDKLTKQALDYEDQGDNTSAINTYQKILKLDTANYLATDAIAGLYGKMGDYGTEIIWAQKTITINPNCLLGYINLGNGYAAQHNYDKATEYYTQAYKLDPKNPYPYYHIGLMEQEKGNMEKAISYYVQTQGFKSNFSDAWYNLATCYFTLKDYARANIYISEYLAMKPDSKDAQEMHANILKSLTAAFSFPVIPDSGKTNNDFVPRGWRILNSAIADLNGDHLPDKVVVLEYYTTINEQRGNSINVGHPRILLILFKKGDHYETKLQHNTFLLRDGEEGLMGDAYSSFSIFNDVLTITMQLPHENLNYDIRYQNNDFYLIHAFRSRSFVIGFEDWDYNFLTRTMKHSWGPFNPKQSKAEWKAIPAPTLKKLSELYKPYSWEVLPGYFI